MAVFKCKMCGGNLNIVEGITVTDEDLNAEFETLAAQYELELDKVKECGFTVACGEGGAPYFEQARLVLVCRKLYRAPVLEEGFVDKAVLEDCYPQRDFHDLYVGEIIKVLKAE